MEKKDLIPILISSLAFVTSIISLIISIQQKKKDDIRQLRKELSETLDELSEVNIAFAEIKVEVGNKLTNDIIELRRSYNGKKRSLLIQADFLLDQNPEIATETDYNAMASNWNAIGNYPKAEEYWNLTIQNSTDLVIKHMNLRGFANFLFLQGNMAAGRARYNEALELRLPDTENVKRIITDTYLMWARVECNFNAIQESSRLLDLAKNSCDRISHKQIKKDMQKQIELFSVEG